MLTLEDFIKKYRPYVAGVIALGTTNARKLLSGAYDKPEHVGNAIVDLNDTTVTLLTMLHKALVPEKKAPLETKK